MKLTEKERKRLDKWGKVMHYSGVMGRGEHNRPVWRRLHPLVWVILPVCYIALAPPCMYIY